MGQPVFGVWWAWRACIYLLLVSERNNSYHCLLRRLLHPSRGHSHVRLHYPGTAPREHTQKLRVLSRKLSCRFLVQIAVPYHHIVVDGKLEWDHEGAEVCQQELSRDKGSAVL